MNYQQRYQKMKAVTLLGVFFNSGLTILKIFFGIIGYSEALIADGLHSFSDILTDIFVLFASKASNQAPDSSHPYGHARVETLASVILAFFLLLVSAYIVYDAIHHMLHHFTENPAWFTLVIAIISILTNELVFRITLKTSKNIQSDLLKANAWHHRSDALSSFVVLIGIAGTKIGLHHLDEFAAIFVALMILKMSLKIGWQNIRELIDTSVDNAQLKKIKQEILKIDGVKATHLLRTRSLGGTIFVDVHVEVDPKISVSEGHYISEQVSKHLVDTFPEIVDVTVHVDIDHDEYVVLALNSPSRHNLNQVLKKQWEHLPGYSQMKKINLHYLHDKVDIDLYFPLEVLETIEAKDLQKQYQISIKNSPVIHAITIYFSVN